MEQEIRYIMIRKIINIQKLSAKLIIKLFGESNNEIRFGAEEMIGVDLGPEKLFDSIGKYT